MFRRLFCAAIALLGSGCASTQLNYNTADLANSLNSLAKKQIFFNLGQALTDPEFVPSQVTISIGTAQTPTRSHLRLPCRSARPSPRRAGSRPAPIPMLNSRPS
jgi:hypothetical protein